MRIQNSELDKYGKLLHYFSNKSRLQVIMALIRKPLSVKEIQDRTNLTQPQASLIVFYLKSAGILECLDERKRVYKLSDEIKKIMVD